MEIQLNNKKYPIKINFNTYKKFDSLLGERGAIYDMQNVRSVEGLIAITYAAMFTANRDLTLSVDDVGDHLDQDTISIVMDELSHSLGSDLEKKE